LAAKLLSFDVSPSIEVQVAAEFKKPAPDKQALSAFCGS
jgi:hypothetical protein